MNLLTVVNQYSGTDEEILEQVRNHEEVQGKLLSSEVITMYLVKHNLYSIFLNSDNPLCIATMRTIFSLGEFNFILSQSKGLMNIFSLDLLIEAGIATSALKEDLISEANPTSTPYYNVKLEDIMGILHPDTWKLVSDSIINNRREATTIRIKVSPAVTTEYDCTYKVSGRLGNSDEFLPIPQNTKIINIPLVKDEDIFFDITLPFDRLVQQFKVEIKGPWAGSLTSVEYIGIVR